MFTYLVMNFKSILRFRERKIYIGLFCQFGTLSVVLSEDFQVKILQVNFNIYRIDSIYF